MDTQWYYAKGNQRFGPVGVQQIIEMVQAGQLAPDDLVWKEGMEQWVPAQSTGLFAELPAELTMYVACPNCRNTFSCEAADSATVLQCQICGVHFYAPEGPVESRALVPSVARPPAVITPRSSGHVVAASIGAVVTAGVLALVAIFVFIGMQHNSNQINDPASSGSSSPQATNREKQLAAKTKAAWDQLMQAELQLAAQSNWYTYHRQKRVLCAQIDTDYIDEELRHAIFDCVRLSTDYEAAISDYLREYAKITEFSQSWEELGALVGSMDRDNPEVGAWQGRTAFRLSGKLGASAAVQALTKNYEPRFAALLRREQELKRRTAALSQSLQQKYSLPFHQRF